MHICSPFVSESFCQRIVVAATQDDERQRGVHLIHSRFKLIKTLENSYCAKYFSLIARLNPTKFVQHESVSSERLSKHQIGIIQRTFYLVESYDTIQFFQTQFQTTITQISRFL